MSFLHKRIKRFELTGQILDDRMIPKMKEEYTRVLEDSMKYSGYIRRLDIDTDWTIIYNGNHYEFILSVYGAYVGKRNALCLDGLDKNRPIYTQKSKSDESSQGQESALNQK